MLGYYNYTVVLTYIGMLVSFAGLCQAMNGRTAIALACLMVSGLCDMFDGKIAATRQRDRQEKLFGVQIDSLSDLICFGVLPAVVVWKAQGSGILAGGFLLCGLIRLAYFNVDETIRQESTAQSRTLYTGLPITSSALILPAVYLLCIRLGQSFGLLAGVALGLTGIAYLLPFQLKKPGALGKAAMIGLGALEFACLTMRWLH